MFESFRGYWNGTVVADPTGFTLGRGRHVGRRVLAHWPASMQVHDLEVVTRDVGAVCAAFASANRLQLGEPDPGFGSARTAPLRSGGECGAPPASWT